MKILTKDGYIDAVALFFELTDEELDRISKNKDYYLNQNTLEEFNSSKGNNAHFFGLSNTNGSLLKIQEFIKDLLKQYKSISWWDREINKFMIKRS